MVSIYWLFLIILLDAIVLAYRDYRGEQERKDLYTRLMAGSLTNYREIPEKPPPRGGNMFTAGIKKAAKQQLDALNKAGDD